MVLELKFDVGQLVLSYLKKTSPISLCVGDELATSYFNLSWFESMFHNAESVSNKKTFEKIDDCVVVEAHFRWSIILKRIDLDNHQRCYSGDEIMVPFSIA